MEEALRRRFVFYGALKSRFTAQFSAANNSDGDNEDDRVDEQKKGQKKRPRRRRRRRRAAFVCPCSLLSICPSAAHPPQFLRFSPPKLPLFAPPSVLSFHMATGNFYTYKDIFLREKNARGRERERTRGETPTTHVGVWKKKRKMESLKPATCVKTFRHSFVPSRPFSPSPAFPCPYSLERGETSDERQRGEGTTGTGT